MFVLLQILLRKGGIAEKGFRAAAQHLLLMPTSFHVDAAVLLPEAAAAYRQARAHPAAHLGLPAESVPVQFSPELAVRPSR